MEVTHDLIVAVRGPGWKYGLARLLINSEKEGVVFVAGSSDPWAFFTATDIKTSRGAGLIGDEKITWRRRGSSCQYKLAKCKLSTEQMTSWWVSSISGDQSVSTVDEDPVEEPVESDVEPVESDVEPVESNGFDDGPVDEEFDEDLL